MLDAAKKGEVVGAEFFANRAGRFFEKEKRRERGRFFFKKTRGEFWLENERTRRLGEAFLKLKKAGFFALREGKKWS